VAKKAPRTKNKDNARRSKKKTSVLVQESVDYIDYKDINLLRRFMSDRAKIRARRVTGNDAQQQREVARAIKNAREMALLPYTNRVTTQRTSRDRGPGGPGRADGPPPRPQGPPPSRDGEGVLEEGDAGFEELLSDVVLDDAGDGDLGDLGDEQAPS
jgi:small subunit ribosomal protein S18